MSEYQPLIFDGTLCQQSYREVSNRYHRLIDSLACLATLLPWVLFRVDGTHLPIRYR